MPARTALAALVVVAFAGCTLPDRSNPDDPANRPNAAFRVYAANAAGVDDGTNIADLPGQRLLLDGTGSEPATFRFIFERAVEEGGDLVLYEGSQASIAVTPDLLQTSTPLGVHAFRLELCNGASCSSLRDFGVFVSNIPAPITPAPVQVTAMAGQRPVSVSFKDTIPSGRFPCWRLAVPSGAGVLSSPEGAGGCGSGAVEGTTVTLTPTDPSTRRAFPIAVWTNGPDGPSAAAWTSVVLGAPELVAIGETTVSRLTLGQGTAPFRPHVRLSAGPGGRVVLLSTAGVFVADGDGNESAALALPDPLTDAVALGTTDVWARTPTGLVRHGLQAAGWNATDPACAPEPDRRSLVALDEAAWVVRNDGARCLVKRVDATGCATDAETPDTASVGAPDAGVCRVDLLADAYGDGVWAGAARTTANGVVSDVWFAPAASGIPQPIGTWNGVLWEVDRQRRRVLMREDPSEGSEPSDPEAQLTFRWFGGTGGYAARWRPPVSVGTSGVLVEPATGHVWSASESQLVRTDESGLVVHDLIVVKTAGIDLLSDGTLVAQLAAPATGVLRIPAIDQARPVNEFTFSSPQEVVLREDGTLFAMGSDRRFRMARPGGSVTRIELTNAAASFLNAETGPLRYVGWSDDLGGIALATRQALNGKFADDLHVLAIDEAAIPPAADVVHLVAGQRSLGGGVDRYVTDYGIDGGILLAYVVDMAPDPMMSGFMELTLHGPSRVTPGADPQQYTFQSIDPAPRTCVEFQDPSCLLPESMHFVRGGAIAGSSTVGGGEYVYEFFQNVLPAVPKIDLDLAPSPACVESPSAGVAADAAIAFARSGEEGLWTVFGHGEIPPSSPGCDDRDLRGLTSMDLAGSPTFAAGLAMPTDIGHFTDVAAETADGAMWVADGTSETLTLWRHRPGEATIVRERTVAVPDPQRLLRP